MFRIGSQRGKKFKAIVVDIFEKRATIAGGREKGQRPPRRPRPYSYPLSRVDNRAHAYDPY